MTLTTDENARQKVTYEFGIYVVLALVALVFRFGMLGNTSLSDHEAISALQAFSLAKGENVLIGGNTGYVGLTTPLFAVLEGNNFWARFWPAVFGTGLVLVPFLYRKYIGRGAAFVLAALIVFDPLMISLSRTAASSIIGITCFFAGFGFFINKKFVLASIFLGIFLSAGTEIWIGALIFFACLLVYKTTFENEKINFKENWIKLVLPGGIVLVAATTLFMLQPNGISGLGSSLAEYFRSWKNIQQIDIGHFIIEVVVLQLPILLFGFVSIITGLHNRDKKTAFYSTWWGLAFIMVLINPSRNPMQLGWALAPLLCLSAMLISRFFTTLKFDNKWIGFGEAFFSIVMIGMSFFYLMNIINFPEIDPILYRNKFIALILPLLLLFAITGLFTWGWNTTSAKNGLLTTLAVIGLVVMVSSGWKATGWTSPIEMQLWNDGQTVTGNQLMQSELADLGRWTNGQASVIQVEVAGMDSPSLNWVLRNIDKVTLTEQINLNTTSEVMITPVDLPIQTSASYRGQKIIWAQSPEIENLTLRDWIKWAVYRISPMNSRNLVLWVRNDLFK
jgi:hypothetical protein